MKQYKIHNWFRNWAEKLTLLFPDWITGKSEIMRQKYCMKYGSGNFSHLIRQSKVHTMSVYMGIAAVFIIITACSFVGQLSEGREINSIQRPGYGTAEKSVPVEVQMKYKDYTLTRNITIKVKQKELNENEKLILLKSYKSRLETLILGENKDLDHVSKPLNLIERDPDTGITVNWISDRPELIGENGKIDLIGAEKNQKVELQAELTLDDITLIGTYPLRIDTDAARVDYERSMLDRLSESLDRYTESKDSENMRLPEELGDGVKIRWYEGSQHNMALIALVFLFAFVIVYFKRYDQINREIKEAEESVARDLPEFINKLVLLLNAGLVASTAFSKIVEDYESFYHTDKPEKQRKKKYLYEELSDIQKRINKSNVSWIKELKEFSQRCGVRELVRMTAVISDNWNKGSMLAEKLEAESELLWISRKKRAEEKGKLAETKLTFPLMILLIVLIMVTIAPAMLEM